MKPDNTPRSDLEIARATIAAAITRNASGIAAAVKPPAPFAREADYYEDWRTYWADIVAPFGEINLDQVQRELSDYGRLLDAVPLVYMHATGGTGQQTPDRPERRLQPDRRARPGDRRGRFKRAERA